MTYHIYLKKNTSIEKEQHYRVENEEKQYRIENIFTDSEKNVLNPPIAMLSIIFRIVLIKIAI